MSAYARIVPFTEHHLDGVLTIAERAWEPVFDGLRTALPAFVWDSFYPDGWQARHQRDIKAVCRSDETPVWVAILEGHVVGFLGLRTHREDEMGEIYVIGVAPDQQGRGVGGTLTKFAFAQMREEGLSFVMAETGDDTGHASARRFYERSGFQRWDVVRYVREL